MDLFEEFKEMAEYKNNIKEAIKLFAIISAMNTQMNEALNKLIPLIDKMANPPMTPEQQKESYKNDLAIVVATLKMQQRLTTSSETAYYQTAVEFNKLLKELEGED